MSDSLTNKPVLLVPGVTDVPLLPLITGFSVNPTLFVLPPPQESAIDTKARIIAIHNVLTHQFALAFINTPEVLGDKIICVKRTIS